MITLSPTSPSREAAMIGRTEFFAPLTLTLPVSLLPPRTINLLIMVSLRVHNFPDMLVFVLVVANSLTFILTLVISAKQAIFELFMTSDMVSTPGTGHP
ncbi:hypothetical protein GCM10008915_18950 [Bifidobacterium pullorum subsp. gallinarum]